MTGHTGLIGSRFYAKITYDKISKDIDKLTEWGKVRKAQHEFHSKELPACEKKANNSKSERTE